TRCRLPRLPFAPSLHGAEAASATGDMMLAVNLGLKEKVAIVTGSSRGLGLAAAQALAAEGCHVVLCARSEGPLQVAARHVAEAAGGEGRVLTVAADVSRADDVRTLI